MNDLKTLRAYYQQDPTLIHATELWQAAAKVDHKAYFDTIAALKKCLNKGEIHAGKIHALAADPLLKVAVTDNTELLHAYQRLKQQFVTTRAQALYNKSRQLFLALPSADFINADTTQCPHTKAVINYYNQLNYFVQHEVMSQPSINARVSAFASWLSVINKLQQQGDYCSFSAIAQALSIGLAKLHSVKNGLSVRQLDQLHNINHLISNPNAIKQMLASHTQAAIPDPSIYRHSIGLYAVDNQQDHSEELTQLQTQLVEHQQALLSDDQSIDLPCEINTWSAPEKKINVSQHEKQNKTKVSANLHHQHKYCLISQLADPLLQQLIINKGLIINESVTDDEIDQLNRTLKNTISTKKYSKLLLNLNIQLTEDEIKQVNRHEPQLYYRSLIDNPLLRKALQQTEIYYDHRGGSTANKIQQLNTQCRAGINTKKLGSALASLGVSLDSDQLQTVTNDINRRRHLTPTPRIEQLLTRANLLLKQPLLKHIKVQMNDTMQLLRYEDDPHVLKQYLGDILSKNGMRNAAPNPYMNTLNELVSIIQQLSTLRTQLDNNDYNHSLLKRIEQFRSTIHKPFYQHLFDRQQLMYDALADINASGQLSADCQQRAVEYASNAWRVSLGSRSHNYINSRLNKLQQRAVGEAKRNAYNQFKHMQHALDVTWQRLCHFSQRSEGGMQPDYKDLLQQVSATKDTETLDRIEQQVIQDAKTQQLQQAWLDYSISVSNCSHQYQTVFDLQKKYTDVASKMDQQYHAQWSHEGNQFGQHKKNIEDLSQLLAGRNPKRLSTIQDQINIICFAQLTSFNKLTSRIASMRKQLQTDTEKVIRQPEHQKETDMSGDIVDHQSITPTIATVPTQSNHWQQVALWGATGAGALILGAAGMHYAPHLIARLASLGVFGVIGIKTAVTASSAAVGGAAGHWFEKNLLNRFGIFASKGETKIIGQQDSNQNQITMNRTW
ncbi:MAG: RasGEF domain-containing protein [Coxiellaceae bacterium]|nr:RasGEF domain-containing protein [Coxiellaceae bacterium]